MASILTEAGRPRFDRGGGAATVHMATAACGARGLLNGFTDIPAGGAIPLHLHDVEESVLVLTGRATAEIDGTPHPVGPGDVVWIEAGAPHRFVAGPDGPVRIFWTYASAAATRTLVASGETRPVSDEAP